jgi:hypothetical protein
MIRTDAAGQGDLYYKETTDATPFWKKADNNFVYFNYNTGLDRLDFQFTLSNSIPTKYGVIVGDFLKIQSNDPSAFQFEGGNVKRNEILYLTNFIFSNGTNETIGNIYYRANNGLYYNGGQTYVTYYYPSQTSSESIAKIQIYNDDDQTYNPNGATRILEAGGSIDIIRSIPGFKFNYLGLETQPYDGLQFSIVTDYTIQLETNATNATSYVTGDMVKVRSNKSNAFRFFAIANNDAWIVMDGVATYCVFGGQGGGCSSYPVQGNVYIKDIYTGRFTEGTYRQLPYYYSSVEFSIIDISTPTGAIPSDTVYIRIPEITEDNSGIIAIKASNWHTDLLYDANLAQFVNVIGNTAMDKVGYAFGNAAVVPTNDAGYVTYRGAVVSSVDPYVVSLMYPISIVHGRYSLSGVGDDINWPQQGPFANT